MPAFAPALGRPSLAALLVGLAVGGSGPACIEQPRVSPSPSPPPESDRFLRIRRLLAEEPQSPARARHLYPLTAPLCEAGPEREAFFETAAWSVAQSEGANQLTTVLAVDVFEFVATACARDGVDRGLAILERARTLVPDDPQLDVVTARLAAAAERFDVAEAAARRAREGGSNHAYALLANIQARRAKARVGPGYEPGMFDAALETVSVEPTAKWQAIDLTAVLSTRARLLDERALWEAPPNRLRTLAEARAAYTRLSRPPFIEAVRRSALDHLCFDTPLLGADPSFCAEAAQSFGVLGAISVAGLSADAAPKADAERAQGLAELTRLIEQLPARAPIVLVFRGDESEVLEWARPAARLANTLDARDPRWVVVDRTTGPRGTAMVNRVLELAGIEEVAARVTPRGDALATPCLAALVAGREATPSCPLPQPLQEELSSASPAALAVLVGRDLDAEIDDFALYDVPTSLLSFRQTNARSPPDAWFKSLSDVWFVLEPPAGPADRDGGGLR